MPNLICLLTVHDMLLLEPSYEFFQVNQSVLPTTNKRVQKVSTSNFVSGS